MMTFLFGGSWVGARPSEVFMSERHPSVVRFEETSGGWRLLVNGQPYFIKGVGCNTARGRRGENYLLMAKEMGANSVRTWGITPRSYLDLAEGYGLMVDAGIWLNPIRSWMKESYEDPEYRERVRSQILAYIHRMKDHPAILFWNLGNEVFTYTETDREKKAFGEFFRELLRDIHQEDPNHPIVFASSCATDLPFLKTYAPTLDAVGLNTYTQVILCADWLEKNNYDKPAFLSEYGPLGSWDRPKDENGMPWDALDHIKAGDYVSLWKQVESIPERCVGGFAFVLGEMRNQDSLTWFNINLGDLRRDPYWALYTLYTGRPPPRRAPRIHQFKVDRAGGLHPGDWIAVKVEAVDLDGDPLRYDYFVTGIASDPLIVDPPVYFPTSVKTVSPGVVRLRVPKKPGIYRVYAQVTDHHKNTAVADQSIQVVRP
jgi:hypothetical protein